VNVVSRIECVVSTCSQGSFSYLNCSLTCQCTRISNRSYSSIYSHHSAFYRSCCTNRSQGALRRSVKLMSWIEVAVAKVVFRTVVAVRHCQVLYRIGAVFALVIKKVYSIEVAVWSVIKVVSIIEVAVRSVSISTVSHSSAFNQGSVFNSIGGMFPKALNLLEGHGDIYS
jgi:hypothetical protein